MNNNYPKIGEVEYFIEGGNISSGYLNRHGFILWTEGLDLVQVGDNSNYSSEPESYDLIGSGQVLTFAVNYKEDEIKFTRVFDTPTEQGFPLSSIDYLGFTKLDYTLHDIDAPKEVSKLTYQLVSGTIEITKLDNDEYEIRIDARNEIGLQVTGYFKGNLTDSSYSSARIS